MVGYDAFRDVERSCRGVRSWVASEVRPLVPVRGLADWMNSFGEDASVYDYPVLCKVSLREIWLAV